MKNFRNILQGVSEHFLSRPKGAISLKELNALSALEQEDTSSIRHVCALLMKDGMLSKDRSGRYGLSKKDRFAMGKLSLHRSGYGFVEDIRGTGDIFIPRHRTSNLLEGDRVLVRLSPRKKGPRREGEVVALLERPPAALIGKVSKEGERYYLQSTRRGKGGRLPICSDDDAALEPGLLIMGRHADAAELIPPPRVEVARIFGQHESLEAHLQSIVVERGLPDAFSSEVLEEARRVSEKGTQHDLGERVDLRDLPFVTIDGESARDFDDAVALRREPGGGVRLWVSIADVSHFVEEGTPLDGAALERGTSVYFPSYCLPMLPEALSNGACSLRPGEDRFTLTAEMLFDRNTKRIETKVYPSVIHSQARLTYRQVQTSFDGEKGADIPDDIAAMLGQMQDFASELREQRFERGSLDFDLPEPQIVLNLQGEPEEIIHAQRWDSHRLIEEFMLAANEAVAEFLTQNQIPFLYRIHDQPDPERFYDFQEFLAHFNLGIDWNGTRIEPLVLKRFLDQVEGLPEEQMINQMLLRSLKQACYSPDNRGHFGLASSCYCHFTSPIRRYPDLQVHRSLRRFWNREQAKAVKLLPHKALLELGEHCSRLERRAMEAEREVSDLYKCSFMESHIGEVFDATISNVVGFGFFVQLNTYFIEGLVHIKTLEDDYYFFDEQNYCLVGERRRRIFRVGDALRVELKSVDLDRREIDFKLQGSPVAEKSGERNRRSSQKKGRSIPSRPRRGNR